MTRTVPRFLQRYKGVEGYYFINRNADLGYIRAADAKPVKENFPQLHDRKFMRAHPDFVYQLETFLRDLQEMSYIYLNTAETGMELGYVLPTNGSGYEWSSSTLVTHQHVVDAMRKDDAEDASPTTPALNSASVRHSVYRGLNGLHGHRGREGQYRYFPVLFFQGGPHADGTATAKTLAQVSGFHDTSLRVLNLLWRRQKDAGHMAGLDAMFDLLRGNVKARSAVGAGQPRRPRPSSMDRVLAARPAAAPRGPRPPSTQIQ